MALSPGPAGLKFWRAPGLANDNTADTSNLPASVADSFYPWGPKRPVQDFVCGCSPAIIPLPTTPADTTNLPAAAADWFYPWGPKRPLQDWLRGPIPVVPVTFTVDGGSYTLTGTAAAMAFGHVAGSGSYSVTGSAVALKLGHVAGTGSYTLTGAAAGLTVAVNYAAAASSYTLTGADASFVVPGGLAAAAGSYTLTGSAADFVIPGVADYLPAGITGGDVPWGRAPRPYWIWSVAYTTATGDVTLSAASGSYALDGADAALTVASPPDTGNVPAAAVNWFNPWRRPYPIALLTRTGRPLAVGPLTLTAAAGSYAITGSSALLTVASPPDTGNFPAAATVWFNPWRRPYPTALLTRTGRPLAIAEAPSTLSADAGSYTTTGSSAALALRLTANSGSYTVSGSAAVLARGFAAGAGAYAILGTDANLVQAGSITLTCGAGSYTLTGGADVTFIGITPPPVEAPGGNYTGARVGAGRGRMIRRRKRGELDLPPDLEPPPLSPSPPDLPPPAPGPKPPDLIPAPQPGLMADMPMPQRAVLPSMPDDEDEDEIALLLEILNRS